MPDTCRKIERKLETRRQKGEGGAGNQNEQAGIITGEIPEIPERKYPSKERFTGNTYPP